MKISVSAALNSIVVASSLGELPTWFFTSGSGNANTSGAAVFLGGDLYLNDFDEEGTDRSSILSSLAVGDEIILNDQWTFTVATASDNTTHWQYTGSATGTEPTSATSVPIRFVDVVAPVITTGGLTSTLAVGVPYSQQFTASGSTATWSVTAGSVPAGMTFSSSGLLSGTPTTGGAIDFTVQALNGAGSDTLEVSGNVLVPPTITTASINSLTVNSAFSQQLAATGDATITYAVTTGSLPAGLSMTTGGLISGTPTTEGPYSFTVTATNSVGSDDQAYSGSVSAEIPSGSSYLTGGVVTVEDHGGTDYRVHTFNTSGTLTFVDVDGALDVDYLVVAGGGPGGSRASAKAGGGGAGGYLTATSYSLGATTTVTVGAGGAQGTNGSTSSLGSIAASDGGGGGGGASKEGLDGGSGGGARGGASASGGAATAGQGSAGGDGVNIGGTDPGSGGGGKSAAGSTPTTSTAGGAGGAGAAWVDGVSRAGGGGGGSGNNALSVGGAGGAGGGGAGGDVSGNDSVAGTTNTGGGGGGGTDGGVGGSGVVKIRYVNDPSYPAP